MGEHKSSVEQSMLDESGSAGENADSENDEPSEKIEPREDDQVEGSSEGPAVEDPSEEVAEEDPCEEEIAEENPNEETSEKETIEEEPNQEEPSEGLNEDPSEKSACMPSSDCDNNEEPNSKPVQTNSAEKRRSVDTEEVLFYSRKKHKHEQPSLPESCSGLPSYDLGDKSRISGSFVTDENASEGQENTGSSGKKRRSRWDPAPEGYGQPVGGNDVAAKRRKTRWAGDVTELKILGPMQFPDFVKGVGANDPEFRELNQRLLEINRKLQAKDVVDNRPEKERSPSPLPIYNELGIRTNTREVRLRSKLVKQKQEIITELVHKNPTFKPLPDFKPQKLYKKLYIPVKEYPGYNFIGLIIGPRGNTQKRMEKETGARIILRGRGSVKEEKIPQKDPKPDSYENEDLHVLVEADNQKSLDAAAEMVEKLLVPVGEEMNALKRAQLRELAELNGTLRDQSSRRVRKRAFKIDAPCDICGDAAHPTVNCCLTASIPGRKTDGNHINFLAALGGGGLSPFSGPPVLGNTPLGFNPAVGALPSYSNNVNKEVDDANLYVGYLPQSVDDDRLMQLFSPFGTLSQAKVIRDKATGFSKGYGFVKYTDPTSAAKAVERLNGHRMDGKTLAVRVAGQPQIMPISMGSARPTSISLLPMNPGSTVIAQQIPSRTGWPGPPGSMLPKAYDSFPKSDGILLHNDFLFKPSTSSYGSFYTTPVPSSLLPGNIASPGELTQFPGNPRSHGSRYH